MKQICSKNYVYVFNNYIQVYNRKKLLAQKKEEENISNITPGRADNNPLVINNISNITPVSDNETPLPNTNNKNKKMRNSIISNQNILLSKYLFFFLKF